MIFTEIDIFPNHSCKEERGMDSTLEFCQIFLSEPYVVPCRVIYFKRSIFCLGCSTSMMIYNSSWTVDVLKAKSFCTEAEVYIFQISEERLIEKSDTAKERASVNNGTATV